MAKSSKRSSKRGPKRTADERERDRLEIAALSLRGWSQEEIAAKINAGRPPSKQISRQMVGVDMRTVRDRWRKRACDAYALELGKLLRQLDLAMREAWEAWERSKGERLQKRQIRAVGADGKASGDGSITMTSEDRDGDPRHLALVVKCLAEKRDALGIGNGKAWGATQRLLEERPDPEEVEDRVKLLNGVGAGGTLEAIREEVRILYEVDALAANMERAAAGEMEAARAVDRRLRAASGRQRLFRDALRLEAEDKPPAGSPDEVVVRIVRDDP